MRFGPPGEDEFLAAVDAALPILLDGQMFSHGSSARLQGAQLPRSAPFVLDIAVLDPRTPPRRPGIRGHQVSDVDLMTIDGLPMVSAADAWCQLGSELRLADLVAAGDMLLPSRRRVGATTLDAIELAVAKHCGKRGMKQAVLALPLLREGVDSRPESLSRTALVAAGLPEPEIGGAVRLRDGTVVHPDLVYRRWRVVIEYEGDGHRTSREQWQYDLARYEALADAGWRVIRVTNRDLFPDSSGFVTRVRHALQAAA